jgi:integrase
MFKRIAYFHGHKTITDNLIKNYQKKRLSEGVSGSTINRELELGKAAFNRAIRKNQVATNPFVGFDKFTETERTRYLTQEELKALLGALKKVSNYKSPHLYEIVLTAIYTGMRLGEILNLHESQVDFDIGIISVKALGTRKYMNHKVIPAPPLLLDVFKEKLKASTNGYVFENPYTGRPHGNIRHGFVAALKKAGIKDFRFHDLRHTFATYALMATKDIRAVQTLLGHTDVRTTQRYAHVLISHKADAMSKTTNLITSMHYK